MPGTNCANRLMLQQAITKAQRLDSKKQQPKTKPINKNLSQHTISAAQKPAITGNRAENRDPVSDPKKQLHSSSI